MKVSVSILSSKNLRDDLIKLNESSADYIHVDVMDNYFVKNKFDPYEIISKNHYLIEKRLDVHLMVCDPEPYIEKYANLNCEYITFHLEIDEDIDRLISLIKNYGIKVGIAIKPETEIERLEPFIDDIDLILVMGVEPGFGGQDYISSTTNKVNKLKELVKNKNISISVDGGVKNNNKDELNEADILVSGSYILNGDYEERINSLK